MSEILVQETIPDTFKSPFFAPQIIQDPSFSDQLKRLEAFPQELQNALLKATDEQWISLVEDPYWNQYRLKTLAEGLASDPANLSRLENIAQHLLTLKPARLKDLVVLSKDIHNVNSETGLALWQKVCLLARSHGMLLSFFQELRGEHGKMPAVAMQLWQIEEAIGSLKPRQIDVIFNNSVAILGIRAQLVGAVLKRSQDLDCPSLVARAFFPPHEHIVESATTAAMAALTLRRERSPVWQDLIPIAMQDLSNPQIEDVCERIQRKACQAFNNITPLDVALKATQTTSDVHEVIDTVRKTKR